MPVTRNFQAAGGTDDGDEQEFEEVEENTWAMEVLQGGRAPLEPCPVVAHVGRAVADGVVR